MVEGANVVFLRVSVSLGNGDGERDGHIVSELAFFCAKACAVDFLLERSHGFVSVDDATAAVGDGECASACEVQRVVGASDDSLACEEVVDLLVCELVGAVSDDGELHDWCTLLSCCLVLIVAHSHACVAAVARACAWFASWGARRSARAGVSVSCAATSAGKRNSLVAGVAEVRV